MILDTTGVNEYRAEVLGVPPVCTVPVTMLSPTITEAADYYAAVAGHGEIGNVTLRVVPRQEPSLSRECPRPYPISPGPTTARPVSERSR